MISAVVTNAAAPGAPQFRSRLGGWLNDLGLVGAGVEIGVGTGRFAERLLETWNGERLYLVDAWKHLPGYRDACNVSDASMERRFGLTKRRLARFRSRAVILRMLSSEAAARTPNGSLDLVYLDANHAYRAA